MILNCPECGKRLHVRDELAGQKGKCPGCGAVLRVPELPSGIQEAIPRSGPGVARRLLPWIAGGAIVGALLVAFLVVVISPRPSRPARSPGKVAFEGGAEEPGQATETIVRGLPRETPESEPEKADVLVDQDVGRFPARKNEQTNANLRRMPLIISRVRLPEFAGTREEQRRNAMARLGVATEYEAGADEAAALMAAKVSGWAAGYEFAPVRVLKKGERPRDVIRQLTAGSDLVLLLRVKTLTARPEDGPPAIIVTADAALYRRPKLTVLLSTGFMGGEHLDETRISGGKVDGQYWMETAARAFAKSFDAEVLGEMQQILQKQEIAAGIARVKQLEHPMPLMPSITPLRGGDERDPELRIVTKGAEAQGAVYLEARPAGNHRKWLLSASHEIDVLINPGVYRIYADVQPGIDRGDRRVYRGEVKIEYKRRYSYSIP